MARAPNRIQPMPTAGRPGKRTLTGVIGAAAAGLLTVGLATWEGDEAVGYKDIVGVATACRGITGEGVVVGRRYSNAECAELNERGAVAHIEPVLARNPNLRGHPHQLAAAGMLAYNIGARAYGRSTVARRFEAGDWRGACDAFLRWNHAGGRVIRGLDNRRRYERRLCLTDLPSS
jgi:lysozyme